MQTTVDKQRLKVLMRSRGGKCWKRDETLPFQWAIEGDIKGRFDNISHHGLMKRVRRRVGDAKLERLVLAVAEAEKAALANE